VKIIVLPVRIDENNSILIAGSISKSLWMIWQPHFLVLAGQKIDQI